MALKKRLKFIRFEVEMKPRIAGESKWNLNFLSKINFIIKNIKYSFLNYIKLKMIVIKHRINTINRIKKIYQLTLVQVDIRSRNKKAYNFS